MVKKQKYDSREEWLEARQSRIGGSDAGAILGLNPWMDNVELWKQKVGLKKKKDISNEDAVKYGHDAEPLIRTLFQLDHKEYTVLYDGDHIYTNDKLPWAHASLDGRLIDNKTGKNGVLEIKTTEILNNSQWDKWDGRIPEQYFAQVVHYMAVTESEFAILVSQIKYRKDGQLYKTTREYRIERNEVESDIEYLMSKEKEFYDCIVNNRMPNLVLPSI